MFAELFPSTQIAHAENRISISFALHFSMKERKKERIKARLWSRRRIRKCDYRLMQSNERLNNLIACSISNLKTHRSLNMKISFTTFSAKPYGKCNVLFNHFFTSLSYSRNLFFPFVSSKREKKTFALRREIC